MQATPPIDPPDPEPVMPGPDATTPAGLEPASDGPPGPVPFPPIRPVFEARRRPRAAYAALFVVAVLAGSALFVGGFALGSQRAATAGTPVELQETFTPFWEAYDAIISQYVGEVDRKRLVEGAIKGMFDAIGDPYSGYMTSEEYKQSLQGISGQFEGIGAEIGTEADDGSACDPIGPTCRVVIVAPLDGSPAEKAGLRAGDVVLAIDGATVEGLRLDDTVKKVRGKKGTSVTLTVRREGVAEPFDISITRDVITVKDVSARLLAGDTVGYLRVASFSSNVGADFKAALQKQLDAGIRSFVLDLRGDPGGFVDAARTVASQFIGSGPIFWQEYAGGRQVENEAESGGLATDRSIRVVVLIDRGSASASEIVTGALQDHARATVVGETSFGKGTVQEWQLLSNDTGGYRLTIAKWLTPDKRWIHGSGIVPDVPVTVDPNAPTGTDATLEKALDLLRVTPSASRLLRAA